MIYSHTRSHEPENQGRRYWDEESTPLFPFGHGLSYGRFSYADLTVDQPTIGPDETLTVSVEVTNTATRPTRSCSSTCTSATARPHVPSAS